MDEGEQSVTRYYDNGFGNTAYIVTGPVSFGGGSSMMSGGEGGGESMLIAESPRIHARRPRSIF